MNLSCELSPCQMCTRVADPENCENKCCTLWRNWFLSRWAILHAYPRHLMEKPPEMAGSCIGGVRYAMPHQVRDYLEKDPCQGCRCGADLCRTPCRARQNWAKTRSEVLQ